MDKLLSKIIGVFLGIVLSIWIFGIIGLVISMFHGHYEFMRDIRINKWYYIGGPILMAILRIIQKNLYNEDN